MGKDFETHLDAVVPATPEQVWDAIATGPGISSWYIGHTEIDGQQVRTSFGDDWLPTGNVTDATPPHHFAHRTDTQPDGRFLAAEYFVEGRDRSATVLRTVTSGFIPGDDWSGEYEAMQYGTALFFATLVDYLTYFPGQAATPSTRIGQPVTDWPAAWRSLTDLLGLDPAPRRGDITANGGTVYFTNPHTLGIRTDAGFFRYLHGLHQGALVTAHALFTPEATDPAGPLFA
jgi:uncharacterized protein YndB with AHSA1/START domain